MQGTEWIGPIVFQGSTRSFAVQAAGGATSTLTLIPTGDLTGTPNVNAVYQFQSTGSGTLRVDLNEDDAQLRMGATATAVITLSGGTVSLVAGVTVSAAVLTSPDIRTGITASNGALPITIKANTAAALTVTDGTVNMMAFDSRNTITGVTGIVFTSPAVTIAGAAGTTNVFVAIAARTITDSTVTGVTVLDGVQLTIAAPTIAQSGGAVTVTTVSTLKILKPVAGASVTITNNYIINTDVAGCFLTAAGVWTDASSEQHKTGIVNVNPADVMGVLDRVVIKEYRYKDAADGGFRRFGAIAEYVPDELAQVSRLGIAARDVAWLGVASAQILKRRVEALEAVEIELRTELADLRARMN